MITRRTRVSRVGLLAAVPLLAAVTLAAGCGTVTTPAAGSGTASARPSGGASASPASPAPVTGTGSAVPTTSGGPVTPGQPACTGWPQKVPRGKLPASFVPVTVLRCVNSVQAIPGKGQWQTATLQRAGGDLTTLTAALRLPPGQRARGTMCPELAILPPQIVVISGNGTMLIPTLPLSGCGMVQPQVLLALSALPWKTVSVRLIAQVQTPQEVTTGCTPGYKDPFAVYGSTRPSPGGAVYSALPASLRICVYASGGSANASQFLRGTTVTGSTVSSLLGGLSGAGSSSTCTAPETTFAVVGGDRPSSPVVYVELGGCYRVLRFQPASGGVTSIATGHASAAAVAIIESVTHPKPAP